MTRNRQVITMLLLKLSDDQAGMFAEAPEAAMGTQFALTEEELGFILSGRVLMLSGAGRQEGKEQSDALAKRFWFGEHVQKYSTRKESHVGRPEEVTDDEIESLIDRLAYAPTRLSYLNPTNPLVMAFILNPIGYLPPRPARPASIYGHLPFTGVTQLGDCYYRCEHWPVSRRVLAPHTVLAGTYGFPESELDFVPTGFAAVGRYALPDLPPACRRYEIRPDTGDTVQCGASVPLYGQAGGGVEVMFPKQLKTAAPIVPPTVLPPL
jgi:hypothetical protein